jgi:uncharacterized protein (DUF58 family)
MGKIVDMEFLNKLQRLSISAKKALAEGGGGIRKSKSKGSSVEFSDYREYAAGDDFRKIDWNAYARFDRLFIKLFMEEREANVNIFLDISKSMDWGEPNKSVTSRKLAAALSYISLINYDRVSLYAVSNGVEKSLKFLRNKGSFVKVINFLESIEYTNKTSFVTSIKSMNLKLQKGISVIISDLMENSELNDMLSYLKYCNQETYVFHVLSPQEIAPEFNENVRIVDSETGMYRDIKITDKLLSKYKKVYNDYVVSIEEKCRKWGFNYINSNTSIDIEKHLKRILHSDVGTTKK